jgi:ATP/maltotriose-dependent transcriptional regulator MalT
VARLCVGLRRYWWLRGLGREGRHWVDLSLAATAGEESEGRLELLVTASSVARYVGQDADARRFADEALDLARQLGQPRELARACGTRAQMAVTDGDFELARRLHQEDAELGHQAGDPVIEMVAIANLGEVALCEHDPETAARYSLQSLAIAQRTEDPLMIAVCQSQLAFAALMMGDLDRAEAHLQGALVPSRALRDLHSGMSCLIGGAALLAGREDAAGAARLLGAVEGLHERTERIVEPGTQPILRQAEELVRRRLEGPALSTPWEEGRNLTLEEALDGIIERVTPRG